MSRLIERLESSRDLDRGPLGFSAAFDTLDSTPNILLIAGVVFKKFKKDVLLADADAFLITVSSIDDIVLDSIGKSFGERVWGVRIVPPINFNLAHIKMLKQKGCDFIVFETMGTEATVTNEDDLGVIFTASHDIDESEALSLRDLQLDAVLYNPSLGNFPLTVQNLVDIRKAHRLFGGFLLVETSKNMGSTDIELLRNLGIVGLVSDVRGPRDIKQFSRLRSDIANLPHKKSKKRQRNAIAPEIQTKTGHGESTS